MSTLPMTLHRGIGRPVVEELEARILYSADFALVGLDQTAVACEHRVLDGRGEFAVETDTADAQLRRLEVAFVDATLPQIDELLQGMEQVSGDSREIRIVVLDAHRDGVQQVSQALAAHRNVSAVHLLSHGADGNVRLGSTVLDFDSLLQHAAEIRRWERSFATDADILIYGCDVARTQNGYALMDALARLTGADVAASDDPTGHAELGGDWELEKRSGPVDTPVAMTQAARVAWRATLPGAPVNNLPGPVTAGEDTAQAVTGIAVDDVDGDLAEVAVSVGNGTLDVSLAGGATIAAGRNGSAGLALSGTQAQINTALGTLRYLGDAEFSGPDSLTVMATDATGAVDTDAVAITVSAVNDAPLVDLPGQGLNYTAGMNVRVINPGAQVNDIDSADFAGGTFVATFVSGADANDRLAIRDGGILPGRIGVSSSNVTYGGVVIGSFSGGTDGSTPLVIALNGNATPAAVQALARSIVYQNVASAPAGGNRVVAFVVTDGDGGTSTAATSLIRLTISSSNSPSETAGDTTGSAAAAAAANAMATHSSGNAASLPTPPPHLTVRLAAPSLEYLRATGVQKLDEPVTDPSGGRPSEAAPLLHSQSVHMPWQSRIGERAVELIAHAGNRAARHAPAAPASASLAGYHSTAPLSALTPAAGLTGGRAIAQPADDGSDQQVDRLLRELAYGISFALSIGAVWWANRAAGLLTSLSFAGAAWQAIDALPVLEPDGGQDLMFGNGARTGTVGRAV